MEYKIRIVSKSSFIRAFGYTHRRRSLVIEFANGSLIRYLDVPLDVFKTFLEAKSYGKFYNCRIKGEFDSERIN